MTRTVYPTLKEIRKAHAWKRVYEKYLPLSRFVFRPLGFLLTWLVIRVGLTSEVVSWLSGFVGLIAYLCLVSGREHLPLIGIGLLHFFNLFDCVDGSIARTMKTENSFGRFLDISMGWVDMGFWGLIGIMAYRHPEFLYCFNPWGCDLILWLAVGGSTCYFSNLFKYIECSFDSCVRNDWNSMQARNSASLMDRSETGKIKEAAHSKTDRFSVIMTLVRRLNHNIRVRETTYFFLLLAYLCKIIDLLLIVYLFYYFMHTIILIIIYNIRGRQLLKFYKQER